MQEYVLPVHWAFNVIQAMLMVVGSDSIAFAIVIAINFILWSYLPFYIQTILDSEIATPKSRYIKCALRIHSMHTIVLNHIKHETQ